MNMSKKVKAAITVAAIAGTCALSSPSFAAWTPDAPTKLGTDLKSSAYVGTSNPMITVGNDGKAYTIDDPTAAAGLLLWTQRITSASEDFVGVTYDSINQFWAVTTNGTITKAATAALNSWESQALSAAARTAIDDKIIAGIASGADNNVFVVTTDGKVVYQTGGEFAANWADISTGAANNGLATADIATNGVNGVVSLSASTALVFGNKAADGTTGNNLVAITAAGVATEYDITKIANIRAVTVGTTYIYVAGDGGKIVRLLKDLSNPTEDALITNDSTTSNFTSISYDEDNTYGYAATADGTLYHITGITVTKKDVSAVASGSLNSVVLAPKENVRRAFVMGDNGQSMYGTVSYDWASVKAVTNAPQEPLSAAYVDGNYYVPDTNGDSGHDNMHVSSNPKTTWSEKTVAQFSAEPILGQITAKDISGTVYVATPVVGGDVDVYNTGNDAIAIKAKNTAVIDSLSRLTDSAGDGETFVVGAQIGNAALPEFGDITAAGAMAIMTETTGGQVTQVDGLAATANGVWIIDSAAALMAYTDDSAVKHLTTNLDAAVAGAAEDFVAATTLNAAISVPDFLGRTDNGALIIGDATTANKHLFVLFDDATTALDAYVLNTNFFNLSYPGTGVVKSVSGTVTNNAGTISANLYVVDGSNDIWLFDGANWEKYGDSTVANPNPAQIAANGANVLAIDNAKDDLQYTTGSGSFAPLATADQPEISSTINCAYNATRSEVYVAGDNGYLYNGTKSEGDTTFEWNRNQDGAFSANKIYKVTGSGTQVFAAYKNNDAVTSVFATKLLTDTAWTHLSGATTGAVRDAKGLSATTLMINDAGTLRKATVTGTSIDYVDQTGTASSVAIPTSFVAMGMLGTDLMYAVTGSELYKFSSPSGDIWTVEKITLPSVPSNGLADIIVQSENKIFVVGADGYAVSYDNSEVTKLTAPTPYNLTSCWSYDGVMFAGDNKGQVHEYNTEAKTWTSGTVQAGVTIKDVTGSSKGEFILAVGTSGTVERSTISSSGGGQTTTKVTPGADEDPNLLDASATSSSTTTSEALKTYYNTPTMTVLGQKQTFKTAAGKVVDGSTHNFKFNVTPSADARVGDVSLFKLLPAAAGASKGSNIKYTRSSTAPTTTPASDGTYWITNAAGTTMATADTLKANTVYSVNLAIKDGGSYDTDSAANGVIVDPTILGTADSSSSSGCVFNPAQSFGLEWLMLMAAPFLAVIRNRFKK